MEIGELVEIALGTFASMASLYGVGYGVGYLVNAFRVTVDLS